MSDATEKEHEYSPEYSLGLPWWTRLPRRFDGNDGLNFLERRYLADRYMRTAGRKLT
jgi:hypothetical protein